MGLFSPDIQSMDDLFLHQLQDVYYAENQIAKALPKMIEKATAPELKSSFETHLQETNGQIERLEQVFQSMAKEPTGVDCPAIDGIIQEANEIAGEVSDPRVLDAALAASAQAVEHYEITRYGTLIAWAKELRLTELVPLFEATLAEEVETDRKLTALAEERLNRA